MQNPAMTISNGRLRFNTACLKKFENVEYVELLLNSAERCIAIRPCNKNNPNAIRWGRLKEGRWCASTLGCRGLAKTLFDIMEWDEDLRYRFRGQFLEQGDNKMMLFAFDEPEMIKVEEIVLPPKENTEEDEGETVRKKIYIFPPEWAGTFGQPITSIAQVGILRQEHYAGNWDVFRPASEIEEMNTFTAESLNKLLHEAEKIMEGCRPQLFEKQQPDTEPKFDTEQQKAAYWIKHFLEKGDMSANEIYCRLDNEGVSKRVARMVKTEMGIYCYQKKRKWYWSVQPEEGAMNGSQV